MLNYLLDDFDFWNTKIDNEDCSLVGMFKDNERIAEFDCEYMIIYLTPDERDELKSYDIYFE